MRILATTDGWPTMLLARSGEADAEPTLEAAESQGAWATWRRALSAMSPDEVTGVVHDAALRGRGGAGYPTGEKWLACAAQPSGPRYVVANGFEADPGAQLDRTLMERDPHAILEGLALASYAVDAHQAYVAVKSTSSVAVRRLREAVRAAEEQRYLGTDILGSGYDLHVEVRELQGSFVLGEETVLLRAIENKRAQPDQRPPYPTERGLFGKPTVVNNVETLAAVPGIVADGGEAFTGAGLPSAPGTTLVQISGAVRQPGIAEVPMGTPLGDVLKLAGAPARPKAVLVGGPSGGFLPVDALDAPIEPGALAKRGAIWGSGTIVVADDKTCIVDMASVLTRYLNDEACGKTIPCRIGLRRLAEIGDRFTSGRPRPTDTQLVMDLAADTSDAALCALESTATNPLLSGMRYFMSEFEDHIIRGDCPAGVCRPLRVAAGASR
ncbi:MAG TPA: NADH-ubiquinone oxidoreductase-F iron-sulfur binding region domain-containing protein [Candidatus Limnocylindrales bacterium]|nr:NADH-ubiquinone oxidoreductase-F iron-sulfur binding region domain-containing protein [Candidatus Limnocylindrales bacterium]